MNAPAPAAPSPKAPTPVKHSNGNGHGNGHKPRRGNGASGSVRETPDIVGERLASVMKQEPGASIPALATAIGKSRTSTVTALHRLRDAGLAESLGGIWSLVEPPAPKETARWVEPISARRKAAEPHFTASA